MEYFWKSLKNNKNGCEIVKKFRKTLKLPEKYILLENFKWNMSGNPLKNNKNGCQIVKNFRNSQKISGERGLRLAAYFRL